MLLPGAFFVATAFLTRNRSAKRVSCLPIGVSVSTGNSAHQSRNGDAVEEVPEGLTGADSGRRATASKRA